ncbi:MAG: acyltransferase [Actinomycetota bacterium]
MDHPGGTARTIPYEPGVDGLRAVSILAVLLFHACASSNLSGWFRGGGLGVSVFFTLSGFLISTLLVTERSAEGRVDLGRFWGRRIRRLVPASLTVVAAVVLLSRTSWFAVRTSDAVAAVWSFTNWHVIAGGQARLLQTIVGPLGPTWSLAVEEQFYVLLAVVVVLTGFARRPDRVLAATLVALGLGSVVLANLVSDWQPRLEFGTDVRAGELAVGGLLALLVRHRRAVLERRSVLDLAGALALVALVVLFLGADYQPPWLLRGGFVLVALVTSTLVVAVLSHGAMHRVLSNGVLVRVGTWSYALYLVHWPIFLVLSPDRVGFDGVGLVAVKVAVAFVVAVTLHLVVEQPLRRRVVAPSTAVLGWLAMSAVVTMAALALLS